MTKEIIYTCLSGKEFVIKNNKPEYNRYIEEDLGVNRCPTNFIMMRFAKNADTADLGECVYEGFDPINYESCLKLGQAAEIILTHHLKERYKVDFLISENKKESRRTQYLNRKQEEKLKRRLF